jgi:acyl-coenzyme A synthetase/AMP-(fatty) acid ligase
VDQLVKSRFGEIECASTGTDAKMKTYITDESLIDAVRQYISNTTHLSETALEVIYLPEIPKSDSGKIRYAELPQ